MTTDPHAEPCTAHIVNEHSGGTHHCTLEAGHTGGQFDGDHAGPVNDKGVRYCWSDHAIGAVPHHSPTASAGLDVSATPSHTELAALAVNSGRALQDEKRHYEIACQENARLRLMVDEYGAGAGALTDKLKRVRDLHRETCIVAGKTVPSGAFKCGMCEVLVAPAAPLRRLADEAQQQEPTETEAHPPYHRWYTETRDDLAEEWAPGMRFTDRAEALARFETVSRNHPLWKDGTPVRRRFVRETTSYTVEQPDAAPRPEPSVHGESVAHLAGLHDAEPTVDARQDGACPPGCIACATDESHDPTWARQDGAQS